MSKKKKKQQVDYDDGFDQRESAQWRQYLLQVSEPIIRGDVLVREFPYECTLHGQMDPGKYPDMWYIEGETYYIRRSRWSKAVVEIRGPFYKKKSNTTYIFKHHIAVDKEDCKKYLKRKT